MAETAVGLFTDGGVAAAVLDALRASGFPSSGIRILSKPVTLPVDNPASTAVTGFLDALALKLRSIGATETECEAYLYGARNGKVLVFATGSHAQADIAMTVMNAYDAIELEEFAGVAQARPDRLASVFGLQGTFRKPERAESEGARVFIG